MPVHHDVMQFTYADDTAVVAQGSTFDEVEEKLTKALELLDSYYHQNNLKRNQDASLQFPSEE